jgi:hypothetical protein
MGQSGSVRELIGGAGVLPTSPHRYASYLRRVLPHLDTIAVGAE